MPSAEIQTSLNAGELSPNLYARVDLEKFESGAALLRNFFVDYRGGVSNRPGTRYIDTIQPNSRLIPFVVSTSAAYVLVFSEELITIYTGGVLVTTVETPYAAEDLFQIKYTQSADVLTLVHPSYPPADLNRTSDTTFEYITLVTGPITNPPIITTMVAPHSGPYSFGYLVTAVDLDGKEESLPSNPAVKHSEALNETTNRTIGLSWDAPTSGGDPQPVSKYNIYKWGPIDAVTLNPATVWGFIGSSQTTTFTDNNIAPDFSKQPPGWGDPFSGGQFQSIAVDNGGSGYDGVSGDWPVIPYVPLDITGDGTGAAGYAVIDHATGKIVGVYLTNSGKNYTTATVTANGQGGSGATFKFTFSDPAALNPAATSYLQQRRVFGGATLKPETIVMSEVGLYNNFNTTPISLATDAIVFSIAGAQVNTIKALVPVSYGMLAFTTGGSFLINGGSPGATISPGTISAQAQASEGANDLPPLSVNYDVLYGQAKGNRIRNLAFAWQRQSYTGSDVSTLAAHLFDTFHTIDWAWAEEPFKIVWTVRDDGKMLSLTYVPDQEVYAWCRHDTQGLFKSVCSVPEEGTDAVYVIVARYTPHLDAGSCWTWFLERFMERQSCCVYDAWFLDCALPYPVTVGTSPLYLSGIVGRVDIYSDDPCLAEPAPFSPVPALGDIITVGCGKIMVDLIITNYHLKGTVLTPIDPSVVFADAPSLVPPINAWSVATPTQLVTGLDHLNGNTVWALADGITLGPFEVEDGTVDLGGLYTSILVGLSYSAQVKTLYLTMEGLQPGTIQGKRKFIPAATLRVDCTKGLRIGQDFDNLADVPELNDPSLPVNFLHSKDVRTVIGATWDEKGEICVQQDLPLPASILGIIVEVTPGDTGR